MSERKVIGYANIHENENLIQIIIVDDDFMEKLPKLAKYEYVIIGFQTKLTAEEKLLREIFGEEACEVKKVKLISINKNEIEVENFTDMRERLAVKFYDINPLYPEYDLPDGENGTPGWLKQLEEKSKKEG